MNCPDCGGPMWDNRETKKNPKQPDFKCKNRQCDKAVWLQAKGSGANRGGGNGAGPRSAGGGNGRSASSRPLGPLYYRCMEIASASVRKIVGEKATPQDIIAATATLFIAASDGKGPLAAPPKPKPAPVVVEENDFDDDQDFDINDATGLPF